MKIHFPYSPLHISGDDSGNAQRQVEADRINRTTNRVVDSDVVVKAFVGLVANEFPDLAPQDPPEDACS